jgi:hypothetical protein
MEDQLTADTATEHAEPCRWEQQAIKWKGLSRKHEAAERRLQEAERVLTANVEFLEREVTRLTTEGPATDARANKLLRAIADIVDMYYKR